MLAEWPGFVLQYAHVGNCSHLDAIVLGFELVPCLLWILLITDNMSLVRMSTILHFCLDNASL